MAKAKGPTGQVLKAIRSGLAKLKRKKLFKGDVRNAKGGWRQKALLKRYADVIADKATAVFVGKDATKFDPSFRAKGDYVVVSSTKGEKFRYSPKGGGIISSKRDSYGVTLKRFIINKPINKVSDIPVKHRKGKKLFYKLPHNPTMDYEAFVAEYGKYLELRGNELGRAVEVYELDADLFPS